MAFQWVARRIVYPYPVPPTQLAGDVMGDSPRTTLSDGTPIYPEHRRLRPDGQQEGYVVLAEEERAKGFVRPVRRTYTHLKCGCDTTMGQPNFYSGTFCIACGKHFPVGPDGEFVWKGTTERVGT